MQENSALGRAMEMVRDLRSRCPWDRAQTRETLRPYLVEEVLEVDQALDAGDPGLLRDEMGGFSPPPGLAVGAGRGDGGIHRRMRWRTTSWPRCSAAIRTSSTSARPNRGSN